jgi:serine/threonine protein kinase
VIEPEQSVIAAVRAAVADRYDVTGTLGSGGMGTVYTGRHRSLNSPVAIKVLPPEIATSEVRLARFRREAALAAHLSHPHVVPVFEFDVRGGLAFLVMPLIDGVTLEEHIRDRGHLNYTEAAELLQQVGSALAFAHDRGIIHRDIKPANILLERATGRWLITDFGIAHVEAPAGRDSEITRTGESIGTPAYMAPEQAAGMPDIDGRADLYALAATVGEALTGQRPDLTLDRPALSRWLRTNRPELSPHLSDALVEPLAAARDRRPAHVRQWLERVAAAERRRLVKPWTAAAALALAALGGWLAQRTEPEAVSAARPTVAVLPFVTSGRQSGMLDSVLPQAFAWQLQMLPDYRAIGASVIDAATQRRFGDGPVLLDTALDLAAQLGATRAVTGIAESTRDRISIRIRVYDAVSHEGSEEFSASGPLDSMHSVVSSLVVRAFVPRLARERTGLPAPSLPRGLPAISAYFYGDQDLRRAAYEEAVEQFNRVIDQDSTYAPAYLKRLLAVVQLLPTEAQIRSAMPSVAHKGRLDPASRQLLTAYEHLINEGDVNHAIDVLQELVVQYPEAVDAWFALAELQFHFGTLAGIPLSASKASFEQVLSLDPSFATALAHLFMLSLAENDREAAKGYIARYLAIDHSSIPAQLIGIADTLLYGRRINALRVLESFPRRDPEVLKEVAFTAALFGRSAQERLVGQTALKALLRRATTTEHRTQAFRMQLASFLGAGQYASAQALVRDARQAGVRQDEVDRWIVLSGITPLPDLGSEATQQNAARRLRDTKTDPVIARWLAARWWAQRDREAARDAKRDFERMVRPPGRQSTPLELSLLDDLDAWEYVTAGDTAGALALWRRATQRFSIEQVPFSTASSLWPLRVSRARLGLLSGRARESLEASATFLRINSFSDQAAWPEALRLRAEAALLVADTTLALNTYEDLLGILEPADGAGIPIRERIQQAVDDLRAGRLNRAPTAAR